MMQALAVSRQSQSHFEEIGAFWQAAEVGIDHRDSDCGCGIFRADKMNLKQKPILIQGLSAKTATTTSSPKSLEREPELEVHEEGNSKYLELQDEAGSKVSAHSHQ